MAFSCSCPSVFKQNGTGILYWMLSIGLPLLFAAIYSHGDVVPILLAVLILLLVVHYAFALVREFYGADVEMATIPADSVDIHTRRIVYLDTVLNIGSDYVQFLSFVLIHVVFTRTEQASGLGLIAFVSQVVGLNFVAMDALLSDRLNLTQAQFSLYVQYILDFAFVTMFISFTLSLFSSATSKTRCGSVFRFLLRGFRSIFQGVGTANVIGAWLGLVISSIATVLVPYSVWSPLIVVGSVYGGSVLLKFLSLAVQRLPCTSCRQRCAPCVQIYYRLTNKNVMQAAVFFGLMFFMFFLIAEVLFVNTRRDMDVSIPAMFSIAVLAGCVGALLGVIMAVRGGFRVFHTPEDQSDPTAGTAATAATATSIAGHSVEEHQEQEQQEQESSSSSFQQMVEREEVDQALRQGAERAEEQEANAPRTGASIQGASSAPTASIPLRLTRSTTTTGTTGTTSSSSSSTTTATVEGSMQNDQVLDDDSISLQLPTRRPHEARDTARPNDDNNNDDNNHNNDNDNEEEEDDEEVALVAGDEFQYIPLIPRSASAAEENRVRSHGIEASKPFEKLAHKLSLVAPSEKSLHSIHDVLYFPIISLLFYFLKCFNFPYLNCYTPVGVLHAMATFYFLLSFRHVAMALVYGGTTFPTIHFKHTHPFFSATRYIYRLCVAALAFLLLERSRELFLIGSLVFSMAQLVLHLVVVPHRLVVVNHIRAAGIASICGMFLGSVVAAVNSSGTVDETSGIAIGVGTAVGLLLGVLLSIMRHRVCSRRCCGASHPLSISSSAASSSSSSSVTDSLSHI